MTQKLINNLAGTALSGLLLSTTMVPGQFTLTNYVFAMEHNELGKDRLPIRMINEDPTEVAKTVLKIREERHPQWKYTPIEPILGDGKKRNFGVVVDELRKKIDCSYRVNDYFALIRDTKKEKAQEELFAREIAKDIKEYLADMAKDIDLSNNFVVESMLERISRGTYLIQSLFNIGVQAITYKKVREHLIETNDEEFRQRNSKLESELKQANEDRQRAKEAADQEYICKVESLDKEFEKINTINTGLIHGLKKDNESMEGTIFKPERYRDNLIHIQSAESAIKAAESKRNLEKIKANEVKETAYRLADAAYDKISKENEASKNANTSEKLNYQTGINGLYDDIFWALGNTLGYKTLSRYNRTTLDYGKFDKVNAAHNNQFSAEAYRVIFQALMNVYDKKKGQISSGIPIELITLLELDDSATAIYREEEEQIQAILRHNLAKLEKVKDSLSEEDREDLSFDNSLENEKTNLPLTEGDHSKLEAEYQPNSMKGEEGNNLTDLEIGLHVVTSNTNTEDTFDLCFGENSYAVDTKKDIAFLPTLPSPSQSSIDKVTQIVINNAEKTSNIVKEKSGDVVKAIYNTTFSSGGPSSPKLLENEKKNPHSGTSRSGSQSNSKKQGGVRHRGNKNGNK